MRSITSRSSARTSISNSGRTSSPRDRVLCLPILMEKEPSPSINPATYAPSSGSLRIRSFPYGFSRRELRSKDLRTVLRPLLTSVMSFMMIAHPHTSRLEYHEEHDRSPTVTRASVYRYRDATTRIEHLVWLDSPCTRGISDSMRHKLAFTLPTATFTLHAIPRGIDTAISLHAATARLDFSSLRGTN